ncbi:hypothetical protein BDZ97DRAFT_1845719 [Flammula alnicola]|nr:hypothetical protein BDZ97DRAFT_1845719 [Flammula alnicola]
MDPPPRNFVSCKLLWSDEDLFSLDVKIERGTDPNLRTDSTVGKHSDFRYQDTLAQSVLSSYSGTTAYPTEDESHIPKGFQATCDSEIDDLRIKSHDLLDKVEQMCKQLVEIRHTIQHRKSQMALSSSLCGPIRRLPVEILCRIFHMCIPTKTVRRSRFSVAPLLLCRVCKAWNAIVTNDPSLWSCIRMDGCRYGPETHFLPKFIRHSQNLPLDIVIVQSEFYLDEEAISLISPYFERCRTLSIISGDYLERALFDALRPTELLQLESVSFRFTAPLDLPNWLDDVPHNIFPVAPRLRTVQLNIFDPGDLDKIALPYSQLRRLVCILGYHGFSEEAVREWKILVGKCTNLETLAVYFHGVGNLRRQWVTYNRLPNTQEEFASLNALKRLTIRVGFPAELDAILRNLSFPALHSFQMESVGTPVRLKNRKLQIFDVLRDRMPFFSGLTDLRLLRISIRDDELRSLLHSTPQLASLDILHGYYRDGIFWITDDDLIGWLTSVDDTQGTVLLPRLRDLRLYFAYSEESMTEDVQLYANLATTRYRWAVEHSYSRDLDTPSSRAASDIRSYPFRLYLKFEGEDWERRTDVIEAMGELACRAFQAEYSPYFLKERIDQDL